MSKHIAYDQEAREAIKRGLNGLAKAVKTTLGPRGRNVIIEKPFGAPLVTKDGVTVAKEVDIVDELENIGARIVKEVSSRTNEEAGDGTTTATVLAEAIFEEGLKNVAAGSSGLHLKRGIDKATKAMLQGLDNLAQPVSGPDDIQRIGIIASNGDVEIGTKIAEAMKKVGKDGTIAVEEGKSFDTQLTFTEGMEFDRGYCAPNFITDEASRQCILENPYVLIIEQRLSNLKDVLHLFKAATENNRPVLVIADDIEGEALATLIVNHIKGVLQSCAVKAPGFGESKRAMLEDLAALTGTVPWFSGTGKKLKDIKVDDLGSAERVIITKNRTIILDGGGTKDDIKKRCIVIKSEIEAAESEWDKEKAKSRLAKLTGGVAKLDIGAATESEMKEKKARVEDALNATRAAAQEGVVPGGGVALIRCIAALDGLEVDSPEEQIGVDIMRRAVTRPLFQIATNAGEEGAVVVMLVQTNENPLFGYNADKQVYGNMIEMGVIDPVKVVKSALSNAAGVAGLLLTTDAVIYRKLEKDANPNPMMPPGMMG